VKTRYFIECTMCGKLLEVSRSRFSTTFHQDPSGGNCKKAERMHTQSYTSKRDGIREIEKLTACSYFPKRVIPQSAEKWKLPKQYFALVMEVEEVEGAKILRRYWSVQMGNLEPKIMDWGKPDMVVDSPEERSGHGKFRD
jgi:hypothetical protein